MNWLIIAWALLATLVATAFGLILFRGYLFRGRLLPIDWGHALLHASNSQAREDIARVLEGFHIMGRNYTFKAGGTEQTVMQDNRTVVISTGKMPGLVGWPVAGRSFVVKEEPLLVATEVVTRLKKLGYTAEFKVVSMADGAFPNSLVTIRTSALVGCGIHLRRHGREMGKMNIVWRRGNW